LLALTVFPALDEVVAAFWGALAFACRAIGPPFPVQGR